MLSRKTFIALLLIGAVCQSVAAQRADAYKNRIMTIGGELKIIETDTTGSLVTLNGKTILDTRDMDEPTVTIVGDFRWAIYPFDEVVLFHFSPGGNSCFGSYQFLSFKQDGSYIWSNKVGNCYPATITYEPFESIELRFHCASGSREVGSPQCQSIIETWLYQKGILQQVKPVQRRKGRIR